MIKNTLLLFSALITLSAHAQQRLVVADKVTHEPIAQASIYTKSGSLLD